MSKPVGVALGGSVVRHVGDVFLNFVGHGVLETTWSKVVIQPVMTMVRRCVERSSSLAPKDNDRHENIRINKCDVEFRVVWIFEVSPGFGSDCTGLTPRPLTSDTKSRYRSATRQICFSWPMLKVRRSFGPCIW